MDEGESTEHAAVREAMEELGIEVIIKQKLAEIQLGYKSRQIYFLVEHVSGEFGTGAGEEYTDADPDDPDEGVYSATWMPIQELPGHQNIYPEDVKKLVIRSVTHGWPKSITISFEAPK